MRAAAVIALLMLLVLPAAAQEERGTPLRNLAPDQVLRQMAYCKGKYRLTMASGETRRFAEINLRLKTDSTAYGPEPDKPVLLPAGMRGDRAQVIFSSPDALKRFLVERCEGDDR